MRGMDRLIDLRHHGLRPSPLLLWMPGQGASSPREGDLLADVNDRPALMDLRAVKGLTVIVVGRGHGGFHEAEAWARAVCAAHAQNVGLAFRLTAGGNDGPAWVRINWEDIA